MPILGIDDTDSSTEMCTTYLTMEILKKTNLDLIGFPRLVRLNPNIPLKTRGNAAISITLGRGTGEKEAIGKVYGRTIYSFHEYQEEKLDFDPMEIIEKFSPKDERTNPALIVTRERENEQFYWDAVREFVDFKEVKKSISGEISTINGEVGIVGANAANSWRGENFTYELVAYIEESKWKGSHSVADESAEFLETNFPETFDNYDFINRYNAIRPTTKTPVLFGIRGIDHENLLNSLTYVRSEPYDSYIIYKTNQGTDDHLVKRSIKSTELYHSSIIEGYVESNPIMKKGGVATFNFSDGFDSITAVAMEPTKEFRTVVMKLKKGDRLRIFGGVTKKGYLNLEKFQIVSLSEIVNVDPPICPNCHSKMESIGMRKGYRCRKCGIKGTGLVTKMQREIAPGYYEVPIIARRHLARPLKLGVSL